MPFSKTLTTEKVVVGTDKTSTITYSNAYWLTYLFAQSDLLNV